MARKIQKQKPPPLSVGDRLIYAFCFLLVFAAAFALLVGFFKGQASIAQRDAGTRMWQETAWAWVILPLLGSLLIVFAAVIWYPVPFFGNRKVRYGEYPYHEYAPLFASERPYRQARPKEYALKRRETLILLAVTLPLFACGLLGLCPRWTLQEDYSLRHYDMLNRCRESLPPEDITGLHIVVRHGTNRGAEYWDYFIRIDTASNTSRELYHHKFTVDDAAGMQFLIDMRASLDVLVTIEAEDYEKKDATASELLPLIAEDLSYDSTETTLLYELFRAP